MEKVKVKKKPSETFDTKEFLQKEHDNKIRKDERQKTLALVKKHIDEDNNLTLTFKKYLKKSLIKDLEA